jgi:hypothetical protein
VLGAIMKSQLKASLCVYPSLFDRETEIFVNSQGSLFAFTVGQTSILLMPSHSRVWRGAIVDENTAEEDCESNDMCAYAPVLMKPKVIVISRRWHAKQYG